MQYNAVYTWSSAHECSIINKGLHSKLYSRNLIANVQQTWYSWPIVVIVSGITLLTKKKKERPLPSSEFSFGSENKTGQRSDLKGPDRYFFLSKSRNRLFGTFYDHLQEQNKIKIEQQTKHQKKFVSLKNVFFILSLSFSLIL